MEQDQEILKLKQQLNEVADAERFFELGTGQLFTQLVTTEVNRAVSDITSDKYDKDHMGYLARKADLNAYKRILHLMQVAAHPKRKAKIEEKLNGTE